MKLAVLAKVNLSLQVRPPGRSGMHPLRSLVTSIWWPDTLTLEEGDDDSLEITGLTEIGAGRDNLVWRAADAVRTAAGARRPLAFTLDKQIPAGAGLGGGSADAAGALVLTAGALGVDDATRDALAPSIGADVPFCLTGGAAWMEGTGERLTPLPPFDGWAIAVAVPPFRLETSAVYRRWDELDGPEGPEARGRSLPVGLRDLGVFRNDLYPAALDLQPELGDWVSDLSRRWGAPVAMSGSGPALFGFFPTVDEAADAASSVSGDRGACGCLPGSRGWRETTTGTLP